MMIQTLLCSNSFITLSAGFRGECKNMRLISIGIIPTLVSIKTKFERLTMRTTIQKCSNDWTAGYFGKDGINHYVTHAKTKDKLLHKLIEMYIKMKGE